MHPIDLHNTTSTHTFRVARLEKGGFAMKSAIHTRRLIILVACLLAAEALSAIHLARAGTWPEAAGRVARRTRGIGQGKTGPAQLDRGTWSALSHLSRISKACRSRHGPRALPQFSARVARPDSRSNSGGDRTAHCGTPLGR